MRSLTLLLTALLALAPALAAQPRQLGREQPDVVARWQETLRSAEEDLMAKEWKRARRLADAVLAEMCDRIESGEGAAPLLALATLLRAVAEAGLGNDDRASWDFGTAQALVPELAGADLAKYHAAGQALEPWRYSATPGPSASVPGPEVIFAGAAVTPPERRRTDLPKYPFAKYTACMDGPVVVQAIIDTEGIPRRPRLLSEQEPVLGYAALSALRTWRFRPATLAGKPVAVYYNLTVNFKLPVCRNPLAVAQPPQPPS